MRPARDAQLAAVALLCLFGAASGCLVDIIDSLYVRLHEPSLFELYLDLAKKSAQFRQPLHKDVRETLMSLAAAAQLDSESDSAPLEPDKILAAIEAAREDDKTPSCHRDIYEQLAALANGRDDDCTLYLIEVVKSAMAQIVAKKKFTKRLVLFLDFLNKHGGEKMLLCKRRFERELLAAGSEFEGHEAAEALEEFFQAGKSVASDDLARFQMFSRIKLATSRFDVQEMGRVAREHVGHKFPASKQQSISLMRAFLDENCHQLLSQLGTTFDALNMARALGSCDNSHPKLLELNELNRLCLVWKKDATYRINVKFHCQLDAVVLRLQPKPTDGET